MPQFFWEYCFFFLKISTKSQTIWDFFVRKIIVIFILTSKITGLICAGSSFQNLSFKRSRSVQTNWSLAQSLLLKSASIWLSNSIRHRFSFGYLLIFPISVKFLIFACFSNDYSCFKITLRLFFVWFLTWLWASSGISKTVHSLIFCLIKVSRRIPSTIQVFILISCFKWLSHFKICLIFSSISYFGLLFKLLPIFHEYFQIQFNFLFLVFAMFQTIYFIFNLFLNVFPIVSNIFATILVTLDARMLLILKFHLKLIFHIHQKKIHLLFTNGRSHHDSSMNHLTKRFKKENFLFQQIVRV
jgi:hypothetical protein